MEATEALAVILWVVKDIKAIGGIMGFLRTTLPVVGQTRKAVREAILPVPLAE
jgi:hypothetical protein